MKAPDKLDVKMIAPCGVNCLACSAYLRSKKHCGGCRSNQNVSKSCAGCAKKKCAFEKGVMWCFECSKFPCARIRDLSKWYLKNVQIDLIQDGFDAQEDLYAFADRALKRCSCPVCGGVIDQYRFTCSECGNLRSETPK